ncbi:molecular chaperone DnaK [Mannheimia granulomatis]|uniref:Molecular chaperone DnaK n=1 Tax=Mannheimia granulomatis TaxID=85402 RepID=A0A011MGP2_9PAST|nr:TraR/DksA family transcriptional regulator [Mannheimia granulomatis]EXI61676.1 molecular chaperone DnaK [Mannheimia granulomatis]RGE48267.1 molecular chaperone DnaK [Mannheimia granulomatis]
MSDQIDRANELMEQAREAALANQLAKTTACHSLLECEDCGEPIPEKRRETVIGCTRCLDCQTIYEQKQKGYRR